MLKNFSPSIQCFLQFLLQPSWCSTTISNTLNSFVPLYCVGQKICSGFSIKYYKNLDELFGQPILWLILFLCSLNTLPCFVLPSKPYSFLGFHLIHYVMLEQLIICFHVLYWSSIAYILYTTYFPFIYIFSDFVG